MADSAQTKSVSPGSDVLGTLSHTYKTRFTRYESDRRLAEQRWLRNLRQYMGVYDPEIERRLFAELDAVLGAVVDHLVAQPVVGERIEERLGSPDAVSRQAVAAGAISRSAPSAVPSRRRSRPTPGRCC